MDQFEETVVNPNISLKNFEVKIREHEENFVQKETVAKNITTNKPSKSYKALLLLAILSVILVYQITVIL
jgi:hypothetical protein